MEILKEPRKFEFYEYEGAWWHLGYSLSLLGRPDHDFRNLLEKAWPGFEDRPLTQAELDELNLLCMSMMHDSDYPLEQKLSVASIVNQYYFKIPNAKSLVVNTLIKYWSIMAEIDRCMLVKASFTNSQKKDEAWEALCKETDLANFIRSHLNDHEEFVAEDCRLWLVWRKYYWLRTRIPLLYKLIRWLRDLNWLVRGLFFRG